MIEGASIKSRVHDTMEALTAAEKRAARGLLANYPMLGLAPVAEFSQTSGASPATVLRFVSKLGFRSYPDFQRALREELDERTKSPLQRAPSGPSEPAASFLADFADQIASNLQSSVAGIPVSEFQAACQRLAMLRHGCHLAGGRFTDSLAGYLEAHLRLVRPGVRRLSERGASRHDELLDVRPGDTAVIFDIRRYDPELLILAERLAARKAITILVTDEWISPISRYARIVLPCRIAMDRTWDSSAVLFGLVEAMIAQVTELCWETASRRIDASDNAAQ